jgi:hypothetical protein
MINWRNVDKLSNGHGILFIYKPINKPVAFIKGYKWLKDYKPDYIDVELLNNNSILFEENKLDGKSIIKKAKDTVNYFLNNKEAQNGKFENEDFRVWFHA